MKQFKEEMILELGLYKVKRRFTKYFRNKELEVLSGN